MGVPDKNARILLGGEGRGGEGGQGFRDFGRVFSEALKSTKEAQGPEAHDRPRWVISDIRPILIACFSALGILLEFFPDRNLCYEKWENSGLEKFPESRKTGSKRLS